MQSKFAWMVEDQKQAGVGSWLLGKAGAAVKGVKGLAGGGKGARGAGAGAGGGGKIIEAEVIKEAPSLMLPAVIPQARKSNILGALGVGTGIGALGLGASSMINNATEHSRDNDWMNNVDLNNPAGREIALRSGLTNKVIDATGPTPKEVTEFRKYTPPPATPTEKEAPQGIGAQALDWMKNNPGKTALGAGAAIGAGVLGAKALSGDDEEDSDDSEENNNKKKKASMNKYAEIYKYGAASEEPTIGGGMSQIGSGLGSMLSGVKQIGAKAGKAALGGLRAVDVYKQGLIDKGSDALFAGGSAVGDAGLRGAKAVGSYANQALGPGVQQIGRGLQSVGSGVKNVGIGAVNAGVRGVNAAGSAINKGYNAANEGIQYGYDRTADAAVAGVDAAGRGLQAADRFGRKVNDVMGDGVNYGLDTTASFARNTAGKGLLSVGQGIMGAGETIADPSVVAANKAPAMKTPSPTLRN